MTTPKEPTPKEWKRRALKAEAELELVKAARQRETAHQMDAYRQTARLKVALQEVESALAFAKEEA